jgi:hypothetical protein
MYKTSYFRVGIEKLDEETNLPTEHIDSWEEDDLDVAMERYESIEIDKHSAKYLMAITFDDEEVLLQSYGYPIIYLKDYD